MKASLRTFARCLASLTIAGLTGTAVSGCAPVEPDPRPAVEWPTGKPAGKLESDPWVQAVRAADVELQIAMATRDFTAPELNQTTGPGLIYEYRDLTRSAADGKRWKFPAGPTPMIPIVVEEAFDGKSATVVVCMATDWYISASEPEPPTAPAGMFQAIDVEADDGVLKAVATIPVMDDAARSNDIYTELRLEPVDPRGESACDLEDAALGYFDPLPDPTIEYGPEDIIVPE